MNKKNDLSTEDQYGMTFLKESPLPKRKEDYK